MSLPIWMYWEDVRGRARPAYLDLCRESIERHRGDAEVREIGPSDVGRLLPDVDGNRLASLPGPVHRSDYLRTRLVGRYGGLWLDADVIAMRPLSTVLARLEGHELVGWGAELDGRFYNNLFAARPGCAAIERWAAAQDEVIQTVPPHALGWSALGQDIMWPAAATLGHLDLPTAEVAPVAWFEWRRFRSPFSSCASVLAADPVTVMLWNSVMAASMGALTRSQLLGGWTLLSRLFRVALGRTTPAEEDHDLRARLDVLPRLRFSTTGRRLELRIRRAMAMVSATGDPG